MRIPGWALGLGLAAPLFFLFLGCLWIDRPGPQYDEALFVNSAYSSQAGMVEWRPEIFGRPLPVMLLSYYGALKGWLYAGLLAVFPPSIATLRAPMIVASALSLVCAFFFAARVFGGGAAVLGVWLAATDPTYLFTSRFDWGPVAIQHLCLMLGCYLGVRWIDSRKLPILAAAAFFLGLGLFDKLTFHWLLVALGLSLLILFPRYVLTELRSRSAVIAALSFLLACSPYLFYRMQPQAQSPAAQIESNPQEYQIKYWMLWKTFNGTALNGWLTPLDAPQPAEPPGPLAGIAYVFMEPWVRPTWMLPALIGSLLVLPLTMRTMHRKALLFCLLVPLIALVQMLPVRTAGAVHHAVLVFPFPQMFVAGTLVALTEISGRKILRRTLVAAAAVIGLFLVATNTASVMHQYAQILRFGGVPYWSEAIYKLLDYLKSEGSPKTYLVEWGMETQLEFLSGAELDLVGLPEPDPFTAQLIQEGLAAPGTLFVTYASPELSAYPETQAFFAETTRQAGYRLEIRKTIPDYHGREIYKVYEASAITAGAEEPLELEHPG